jgi:hypothetical protein
LRGRTFIDIFILQAENLAWLQRTANAKVHSTTKNVPYEEWLMEKDYLKPAAGLYEVQKVTDQRDVSKDNVISHRGNFYRVPRGTYHPPKTKVRIEENEDNQLIIYNTDNKIIATHAIYPGKGKTIGGTHYSRDLSESIDTLISEITDQFTDPVSAKQYCEQIRKDKPRYIRDQMLIIKKLIVNYPGMIVQQAVAFCMESHIYRATDLESVVKRYYSQQSQKDTLEVPVIIKTINQTAHKIIPDKSDISDYQSIMS